MNKAILAGGGAALILIAGGVGGYIYVSSNVNKAVETALTTTLPAHPAIKSLDYDDYDIDLLGNSLRLHNPKIAVDLSALPSVLDIKQPGLDIGGTINVAYNDITAQGIWGLAFGSTTIDQVSFSSSAMDGTVVETLADPDSVEINNKELVSPQKPVKSATITMGIAGTLGPGQAHGVDIGNLQQAGTKGPFTLPMDNFSAKDLKLKLAIDTKIERPASEAAPETVQNIPTMDMDIGISKITARGITPKSYRLARYENVSVTVTPKDTSQGPQKMTIGEIAVRDALFEDFMPVRFALDINDWVFETPNIDNPQAQMFRGQLGIEQINLNLKLNYAFDRAKKTLNVQPFRLGLKQAGTLNLGFHLEGLPKPGLFDKLRDLKQQQDQEQLNAAFEEAFQDVALDELNVGYADEGALKSFLAGQAQERNVEPAKLAEVYAKQGAFFLSMAFGKDKSEDIRPELVKFLTAPDTINFRLKAKLPLKLKDFMADLKVSGPQALMAYQLYVQTGKALN